MVRTIESDEPARCRRLRWPAGDTGLVTDGFADVVVQLQHRIDALPPELVLRRTFIQTYRRTTEAVGQAVADGRFADADWVTRWDVVFAAYFLVAHDADRAGLPVSRPWRLAFDASADHHRLVHLLLGMNAHINYDLPQAMLDVISPADFEDLPLLGLRRLDHERIDDVLAERIAAEDHQLGGTRRRRDRLLTPLNRWASRRFLRQARRCVWHNVLMLHDARSLGPAAYEARLGQLEVLTAAKIAALLHPGQVLLRLAVIGFGVRLPPPPGPGAWGLAGRDG